MSGFAATYTLIATAKAEHMILIGIPVNDVFHAVLQHLYTDPFHKSQLRIHGYITLADIRLLCEDLGLHDYILDRSLQNDRRKAAEGIK